MKTLILAALLCGAPGAQLPADVEKVASPDGKSVAFIMYEPGDHTFVGVASASGAVRWHKDAGIRPILSTHWSADSSQVMVVTDCLQAAAELKNPKKETMSWLLLLDASDGKLVAQGDLDTDVLELGTKLPDAVGAAHVIDSLTLERGMISATIKHRGTPASGSAPVERLKKP